jgi:hypothetical protein
MAWFNESPMSPETKEKLLATEVASNRRELANLHYAAQVGGCSTSR